MRGDHMLIGIDLGTSTTLIAKGDISTYGNPKGNVLEIAQTNKQGESIRSKLLPSVAFFPDEKKEPIVGTEAREKEDSRQSETNTVRAVKRLMGRDIPEFSFQRRLWSPADISALYIEAALKNAVTESAPGTYKTGVSKLEELTVTVPASFTIRQRKDTLDAVMKACEKVGWAPNPKQRDHLLISEPLAALFAFLSRDIDDQLNRINLSSNPRVLVYDIGGGTLDLTLVELSMKPGTSQVELQNLHFEIIGVSRFNQIGGEDFDEAIAIWLHEEIMKQHPSTVDKLLSENERQRLRYRLCLESEEIKREYNELLEDYDPELDEPPVYSRTLNNIPVGKETLQLKVQLDHEILSRILKPFLELEDAPKNCIQPLKRFLQQMGVTEDSVEYLLCVGGMSRFSPLMNTIQKHWPGKLLHEYTIADQLVAQGAAIYSTLKNLYNFRVAEPAGDAYYIKLGQGFMKILGRHDIDQAQKRTFFTTSDARYLNLFFFAGEESSGDEATAEILPTLLYQGGGRIDLGKEYPQKTAVEVQMCYVGKGGNKTPQAMATVDGDTVFNGEIGN